MFKHVMAKSHFALQNSIILLLQGYQYLISPLLRPSCRFYPSCSSYAIEAFRYVNLFKAAYLTLSRILKCHPFHPGGYDPLEHHRSSKDVR